LNLRIWRNRKALIKTKASESRSLCEVAAIIGEHLQGLQSHPDNQVPGLYLGNDLSQGKRRSPLNAEVKIIAGSEGDHFFALSVLFWTSIRLAYQG
jgi:hypothetical protein